MNIDKTADKVYKQYGVRVGVNVDERSIILTGECDSWDKIVAIGKMFVGAYGGKHVVNNITLAGYRGKAEYLPDCSDKYLDGTDWDVVIIGGGISGCSVARELSRYNLRVLLCEKHSDVARGASGANDGMVHAGIDIKHDCNKLRYGVAGNAMYDEVCRELGVEFNRCGQYVIFTSKLIKFLAKSTVRRARKHGIPGVAIIDKKQICEIEPRVKDFAVGALYVPSTGVVSPYKFTIAYAENAVHNGVKVALNTAVLGMEKRDGKVSKIITNRGTVTALCVVNCAGVFADKIAQMAEDGYFTIHPRKGTDLLMDPKADGLPTHCISMGPTLKTAAHSGSTKGGGIILTVDGNILIGPDAVEIPDREDTATSQSSIDAVFEKHSKCCPSMSRGGIIAYFAGVRAATYEEDFIIERSTKVPNMVHVAGIQSPGLTAAPAFSKEVARIVAEYLGSCGHNVQFDPSFDPKRKAPVCAKKLSDRERDELIKSDPDFGKIICRCEQVSLGEIKQAVNNPLGVHTIDGVKRRVRAGMGRCQGGFCMPLVTQTIADQLGIDVSDVTKDDIGSNIAVGQIKELKL